jgi:hypothetical protein
MGIKLHVIVKFRAFGRDFGSIQRIESAEKELARLPELVSGSIRAAVNLGNTLVLFNAAGVYVAFTK